PWLIILYAFFPRPESKNSSVISFSLAFLLLIKYSLSPLRYSFLEITTSLLEPSTWSSLFKIRLTEALFIGVRLSVPSKIISSIFEPRITRADCSSSTHLIVSTLLLLLITFEHLTADTLH